jgi:hypothetical protein
VRNGFCVFRARRAVSIRGNSRRTKYRTLFHLRSSRKAWNALAKSCTMAWPTLTFSGSGAAGLDSSSTSAAASAVPSASPPSFVSVSEGAPARGGLRPAAGVILAAPPRREAREAGGAIAFVESRASKAA